MNVNPALKSMANEENAFQQAAPMLLGEEFAKKATDRVEAIKAIKKISYQKTGEKRFFGCHPWNQTDGRGVVTEAAAGDSSLTRRPERLERDQATQDQAKDTKTTGVLSTANDNSHANGSACRDGIFRGAAELDFSRNTNVNSKGSGELTGTSPSRLRLPVVSGPQKRWGFQPVVNLKALNKFIQKEHFKMEGFHMVRDLVRHGDWLAKIDLKDASRREGVEKNAIRGRIAREAAGQRKGT